MSQYLEDMERQSAPGAYVACMIEPAGDTTSSEEHPFSKRLE